MQQKNSSKILLLLMTVSILFMQGCNQKNPSGITTTTTTTVNKSNSHQNDCTSKGKDCYDIDGSFQSPINIAKNSGNLIVVPRSILSIKFDKMPIPVKCYLDTSHGELWRNITVNVVNLSDGNYVMVNKIKYKLIKFHFHRKCEHILPFVTPENSMEVHYVFKSDSENGNLVVLGLLFNAVGNKDNNLMDVLWDKFNKIHTTADTQKLDITTEMNPGKPLENYFRSYYSYSGSLTTPCFLEGVTWFVSPQVAVMSGKQLDIFRAFSYRGTYLGREREAHELQNRTLLLKR